MPRADPAHPAGDREADQVTGCCVIRHGASRSQRRQQPQGEGNFLQQEVLSSSEAKCDRTSAHLSVRNIEVHYDGLACRHSGVRGADENVKSEPKLMNGATRSSGRAVATPSSAASAKIIVLPISRRGGA